MKLRYLNFYIASAFLFFLATPAWADAGVPMIFITLPYMLLALIPIIFIESKVLLHLLPIKSKNAYFAATVSNLVSTIIGIPITWLCLVILEIMSGGGYAYELNTWWQKLLSVTWQAPWLIPYEGDLKWMIPAATMVLLIPFFFISWLIEYWVTIFMLRNIYNKKPKINSAVFWGNFLTYSLLELFALIVLIVNL